MKALDTLALCIACIALAFVLTVLLTRLYVDPRIRELEARVAQLEVSR